MSDTLTFNARIDYLGSGAAEKLAHAVSKEASVGHAAAVETFWRLLSELNLPRKDLRFGVITRYEPGSRELEIEYSTMRPLEWTLRDTAITFAHQAMLPDNVMILPLDFSQKQPVIDDPDDPITMIFDLDDITSQELTDHLYRTHVLNLFAANTSEDGLSGWEDAESFEEALGRKADMHNLAHVMNELGVESVASVARVRQRLEDLVFFPKLDEVGWPQWDKLAVITAVNMIASEESDEW
jgi:hypothetical protein